jgi:hypothetical protein
MVDQSRDNQAMSITADMLHLWACKLQRREAMRSGATLVQATDNVARRYRIAKGSLENAIRGRLKTVRTRLAEQIRAAVVREYELEIAAMENELCILRATAVGPAPLEISAVEALLSQARELLKAGAN